MLLLKCPLNFVKFLLILELGIFFVLIFEMECFEMVKEIQKHLRLLLLVVILVSADWAMTNAIAMDVLDVGNQLKVIQIALKAVRAMV